MSFPLIRLRRLRFTPAMRDLVHEVKLDSSNLVYPIFVDAQAKRPVSICSMPGYYRLPPDQVVAEAREVLDQDVKAIILFGIPKHKDALGSESCQKDGFIQKTITSLKKEFGNDLIVIADVCLCEYTNHGHCGIVENGTVVNDSTLEVLNTIASSYAQAGVDIVAPSAMMDGQVGAIRDGLDDLGFENTLIMSYSAKFSSSFYGPFRAAVDSTPHFGDRQNYQLDYRNRSEVIREITFDVDEGADIIMVKPALPYLDIIHFAKLKFNVPLAAYQVSGEYSIIKAAAQNGWIKEKDAVLEVLTSIKRAGANFIITYFAKDVKKWLNQI